MHDATRHYTLDLSVRKQLGNLATAMTDANLPPAPHDNDADRSIFTAERMTQCLIGVMVIVSCVLFSMGAKIIGWPSEPGFRASLAQPPVSIAGFLTAIVLLCLCTALGTAVLGRRWFLAGLMSATAGLAVWSVRGGPTTPVVLRADTTHAASLVFFEMLAELIVLFAVIAAIWNFLWTRMAPSLTLPVGKAKHAEEGRSTGAAVVAQAAMMAVFVLIFVATSQKKQVMIGVFLAGLFSTSIAESFFADRKAGRWYWAGPLIAGAAGYIVNMWSPQGVEIGDPSGTFAALARVLPLDYASLGCAGTLLGYWWAMPGEEAEETSSTTKT